MNKLSWLLLSIALVFAAGLWFLYKNQFGMFLTFSDGAKFADVARNVVTGNDYGSSFSFFNTNFSSVIDKNVFSASAIPIAMPLSIALVFRIFGISDQSVILTSGFYFLLLVASVYLLGKKIYGNLVGFLSAIAVASSIDFLNYSTSGASEVIFSFFAVISCYFIFAKRKITDLLFLLSLICLYLARPQGVIFILSLIFCWLVYRLSLKKGILIFIFIMIGLFSLDKFVLYPLSFKYPVYPIVTRGIQAVFQYSPTISVSDALRGQSPNAVAIKDVIIKTFYNIYNFYKLLPNIMSPYLAGLFLIGILIWRVSFKEDVFKLFTIIVTVGTILLAALTIPFYRYLHPIVPFIYIVAVGTLVWITEKVFSNKKVATSTSLILVLMFIVFQTLGVLVLDTRFVRTMHNVNKPPVYSILGKILRENTHKDQIIITNLDTWGTWYGERKTVWFPLEPKQLIDHSTGKIPFEAIYLTSYLVDDENYYMNNDWRQILDNPTDSSKWTCDGCQEIAKEFKLKGQYYVNNTENYQKMNAKSVLLIKR